MSKSLIGTGGSSGTAFDNNTSFGALVGGGLWSTAAEATRELPVREAGSFSNLYTYSSANAVDEASTTITLRKSAADTTLLVTYTASQTGIKTDTDSVSYADTDEVSIEVTVGSDPTGAIQFTLNTVYVDFTPTDTAVCITLLGKNASTSNFSTDSTTRYSALAGGWSTNDLTTTEADVAIRVSGSFLARNFFIYVTANARTTDTVLGFRKNAGNGNQVVTYTSGQTGVKEDTSNTDSIVANDEIDFYITTSTGGGTITFSTASVHLESSGDQFLLLTNNDALSGVNFNLTRYPSVSGRTYPGVSTEINSQALPVFEFNARNLHAYCSSNSITTSPTTLTVRDNGADSAITVSWDAAQTGLKSDTTNNTDITSGDELGYILVTPNTSGTFVLRWTSLMGTTQSASGPANLKTYNTNVKSNIKTINTNPIANVKSLDTNV